MINGPSINTDQIDLTKFKIQSGQDRHFLSYLYDSPFKAIDITDTSRSHANLLIDFAKFTRHLDLNEAANILAHGRKILPIYSIIHIASAELELERGKREEALSILVEALSLNSEPASDVIRALQGLTKCKTDLSGRANAGQTQDETLQEPSRNLRLPNTEMTASFATEMSGPIIQLSNGRDHHNEVRAETTMTQQGEGTLSIPNSTNVTDAYGDKEMITADIEPGPQSVPGHQAQIQLAISTTTTTTTTEKAQGTTVQDTCDTRNQHKRHKQGHTNTGNYKCDICNSNFVYAQGLRRHKTRHTGDKQYKCGICNHSFAFLYTLKQHMAIHFRKANPVNKYVK